MIDGEITYINMVDLVSYIDDDDRIIRIVNKGKVRGSKYKIKREMKSKNKPVRIGNMNSSSTIIINTN